jgi:hypothetical protein
METNKTQKSFSIICADWTVMLCDVLLFASALNCLFLTLAYRKTFDIVLFVISLCLAIAVYFFSISVKKNPIISKRVIIAVSSVIVWAILIPVLQATL